jgi:hypothetical protein
MKIRVLKEYNWLCKLGSLVVGGKQVAPPEEKLITYPEGKILTFQKKKELNNFVAIHKNLQWTYAD